MARKIIGYYNDTQDASDADQLTIAIGCDEMICLVKGAVSQETDGFEMFRLEKDGKNWNEAFDKVKNASKLLSRTYHHTHCFYHFEEAIVIPEQRFTAIAAQDYLSLLYGESDRHEIKYEVVQPGMINAYRIGKSLNELMDSHFLQHKPHHAYSGMLEDILVRPELADHFIKVQFYYSHIIVAVVKNKKLQLIQTFSFTTPEDILYHILNTVKQFELDPLHSHIEISGQFETGSQLHKQLQPHFGLITFDGTQGDGVLRTATGYPTHFFTPFYKLVV